MKPALIYTGGTIGSAGEPLEPLAYIDFQALWQRHVESRLGAPRSWHWIERPVDSTEAAPGNWLGLARLVLDAGANGPVIMLHGTDTLAWSTSALAMLLTLFDSDAVPVGRHSQRVVVTGSQRPLFSDEGIAPGTDAIANLELAYNVISDAGAGVTVAFAGETLPGARVMKVSATDDRAFACPRGWVPVPDLPEAEASALSAQLDLLTPHFGRKIVLPILAAPAEPDLHLGLVDAAIRFAGNRLGAIHLHGFGIGNFPAGSLLAPVLAAAHQAGALIVADSQTPGGAMDPGTYGAGSWLADLGALSAGDMTPAAVDAKLHLTLALGAANSWSRERMEEFFLTPAAGERS
ncbi:MAG: asparaginase domain-containing protein [Paracoccaceae bacterium]|nr:asparaginase domain-containing protein [Paracoccaceae bacterium]